MEPLLSSDRFQNILGEDACQSLRCAICLDFYEQPVSLLCGHSFCYRCIRDTAMHVLSCRPHIPPWQVYVDCPTCRRPNNAFKVSNNSIPPNFSLSGVIRALSDTTIPLPSDACTNTNESEMKTVSTQTDQSKSLASEPLGPRYEHRPHKLNMVQAELEHVFSKLKRGSCVIDDAVADINAIRNNLDSLQETEVEEFMRRRERFTPGNTFSWQRGMPISISSLMGFCPTDQLHRTMQVSSELSGGQMELSPGSQSREKGQCVPVPEDPAIVSGDDGYIRHGCSCIPPLFQRT